MSRTARRHTKTQRDKGSMTTLLRTVSYVREFVSRRQYEALYSVVGVLAGGLIGLAIGGIGIAALGGARGVPGLIVCGVAFGLVGNRIGLERDRFILKRIRHLRSSLRTRLVRRSGGEHRSASRWLRRFALRLYATRS